LSLGRRVKILFISPRTADLPGIDAEIAELTRYHQVEMLVGSLCTEPMISRATREEWDVVWWAGHLGENGFPIHEKVLDVSAVVAYMAAVCPVSDAVLIMLNTCSSLELAQHIVYDTYADAVCTISNVPDPTAMQIGIRFARSLAKTKSFEKAYNQIGQEGYLYLPNQRRRDMGMADEDVRELSRTINDFVKSYATTSMRWESEISGLRSDVSAMRNEITKYSQVRDDVIGIKARLGINGTSSPLLTTQQVFIVITAILALSIITGIILSGVIK
jgi:hypothetical protein